jgi:hypothetical protein
VRNKTSTLFYPSRASVHSASLNFINRVLHLQLYHLERTTHNYLEPGNTPAMRPLKSSLFFSTLIALQSFTSAHADVPQQPLLAPSHQADNVHRVAIIGMYKSYPRALPASKISTNVNTRRRSCRFFHCIPPPETCHRRRPLCQPDHLRISSLHRWSIHHCERL